MGARRASCPPHFLRIENETQDGNGALRAQVAHPNVRNHADIRSRFANCRDAELRGDMLVCYWQKSVPVLRNGPIDDGKLARHFTRMCRGKVRFE